ncbi:MAG TPA: DUF4249 domain-containing protein [Mucilaginibacter sp.]|nr:DUF4249 domain-containing protein [Mucilaginibacter sp.]
MKRGYIYAVLITAAMDGACKKPYSPVIKSGGVRYLVVEGVINPGSDSTIITLSRTVKLSSKSASDPELHAQVTVESDQSAEYPLLEIGGGKYASPGLNLDNSREYRLKIKTADGKEYASDLVPVKITPPIDSVGYKVLRDSLEIYANAHDPTGNTKYYRWDYDETWRFHALYDSQFISNGHVLEYRTADQEIFFCFKSDTSADIVLGTSNKLSQDVIYQNPIVLIRGTSEKVELEYSILVRQYALTKDAYDYWQNIKKNTEQIGSIFDAQPSEATGNIHCTSNPSVPVLGYISVCTVPSKRIFITKQDLPDSWQPIYPYTCGTDTLKGQGRIQDNLITLPPQFITVGPVGDYFNPTGWVGTDRECADCTIRGDLKPPAFWIYK